MVCHWDPTWSWAQLQLVAACFGPDSTIFVLTAARVVFLVAFSAPSQQRTSSPAAGSGDAAGADPQEQRQVLQKFSVKVRVAVRE
jgi:hypothetical protein